MTSTIPLSDTLRGQDKEQKKCHPTERTFKFFLCFVFLGGGILLDSVGDIRDEGSIPGFGMISPGVGNDIPPQYSSYLENSMVRGAWQATVHRSRKESDTSEVI